MNKKFALIGCGVLLAALIFTAFLFTKRAEEPIPDAGTAQHAVQEPVYLTYKGEKFPIKKQLQTVLLIGTDNTQQYQEKTEGVPDYSNNAQADFLMLVALDTEANTAQIIQLNRDTMTEVPWLDVFGEYGGTEFQQLCLAFNYGDGGAKSCKNTVNAVSSLLFDAPIQGYIQVPMTAVPVLNDLVGGVPVTIAQDLTMVDPAFVQGATVRLSGAQAEKFVRVRSGLEDDTNLARMGRQRQYLDSFQKCAREAFDSDSEFAVKLLEKMSDFLQSNLSAQQLTDLITKLDQAEVAPIGHAEGELKLGEKYYEFYVNQDSLWELVKKAYCA